MLMETKKKNILVIEDDSKWRKKVNDLLSNAGYAVSQVDDFTSAMEILEGSKSFDLVILDLHLKQKDFSPYYYKGWEILEEIKKNDKISRIPTLVITGHPAEYLEWREKKEVKADSFVSKQRFTNQEFLDLIKKLISGNES